MIRTAKEQALSTRRAREWRDRLTKHGYRRLTDDQAYELARCLDELQHAVAHQLTFPEKSSR